MAYVVKKKLYAGGIEERLDTWSNFLLSAGIIGAIAGVIVAIGEDGVSLIWVAISAASLIEGITLYFLLSAFAEFARVLKKMAGVPFAGSLNIALDKGTASFCSNCGERVGPEAVHCWSCRAKFETADTPSET